MEQVECQSAADAMMGAAPMRVAAHHEPTDTWLSIDAGALGDMVASLQEAVLSDMEPGVDEMGWAVCGCMDCQVRRTIVHLIPRVLMAAEEGLIRHARGLPPSF